MLTKNISLMYVVYYLFIIKFRVYFDWCIIQYSFELLIVFGFNTNGLRDFSFVILIFIINFNQLF